MHVLSCLPLALGHRHVASDCGARLRLSHLRDKTFMFLLILHKYGNQQECLHSPIGYHTDYSDKAKKELTFSTAGEPHEQAVRLGTKEHGIERRSSSHNNSRHVALY